MASLPVCDAPLARLRRRHAALAARVAAADPAGLGVETGRGPTGAPTLAERGRLLASAWDPEAEGARIAAGLAAEPVDLLVAVGFGLGHHLDAFRRLRRVPVLVFEPSPARLRAALAARGDALGWLDDPDVHWAADVDELAARFAALYTPGLAVRVHAHPAVRALAPEVTRDALARLAAAKGALDLAAGTRVAMMAHWSALTVENAPRWLAAPSAGRLFGAFRGVPAVVVAAGPSLDGQLEALVRHRERLLVIAIGQALPALRAAGVAPDLVHVIESKDVSHQLGPEPGDLALVVPPSVHPAVLAAPVRARFVAVPEPNAVACWLADALGEPARLPGGASVAQSAVHLAAALGADPIALVGQDLAFSGGRVYARGSAYDMVSYRELGDGRYEFTGLAEKKALLGIAPPAERRSDDLVRVEGWDGERVPTSKAYAAFLEHYRGIGAALAARGVRLVNCSVGGARIPGIAHEPLAALAARLPDVRVDGAARVRRLFDEAPPAPLGRLPGAVARARRALARLEDELRAGAHAAGRARAAAHRPPRARAHIDALRALARSERRVRRALEALPWLDVLAERARLANAVAARRSEAVPDLAGAVAELERLLAAAGEAAANGGALLAQLAARLAGEGDAPAPGRGAAP